jgi:hypothetical protein
LMTKKLRLIKTASRVGPLKTGQPRQIGSLRP